jgi:hypothetical protein
MIEYENEEELDFGADLIEGDLSTNLFEESQKDNTSLIKVVSKNKFSLFL